MSHTSTPFDLLATPLEGSHLLEAGAGTGKTFSLSFLYLRLLLEKALHVEDIVVVTFTNAATAELKERIYARLFEAETTLLAVTNDNSHKCDNDDDLLTTWVKKLIQQHPTELLHKRLRLAQAQFDRCRIHSINGFALQLLHEHAVTLGHYVPEIIADDNSEWVQSIYLSLARDNFHAFGNDANAIGQVVADKSPSDLWALLAQMLANRTALENGEAHFPDTEQASEQFTHVVKQLQHAENTATALQTVREALAKKHLKGNLIKSATLEKHLAKLQDDNAFTAENQAVFTYFSAEKLNNAISATGKKADVRFDDPVFQLFGELAELCEAVQTQQSINEYRCLMLLVNHIEEQLTQKKSEQMALTHDDVVTIVAQRAQRLKNLPYKALLLDEAQDTNATQLQLFTTLFLQRGCSCFFVGDPKQAIYGFRGGDVYTYLALREQVEYTHRLPTNYRSTQAVNDSINTLFAANPFAEGIDYQPIDWDKPNNSSDFGERSLTIATAAGNSTADLAETAAREIVHCLNVGYQMNDPLTPRLLRPADIAVLVRSRSQALLMQSVLAEWGLSASYTGKNSVYATDEAILMHTLLSAINDDNPRKIRALMLSPLLCYPTELLQDSHEVNTLRRQLANAAQQYREQGFAASFYRLMRQWSVGGTLLTFTDGKRRLSNFIQLFELLQQALQTQALSLSGLCDYLLCRIKAHDKAHELRLEDPNAVSIITMHSAKGLEFPVVCLPFLHYEASQNNNRDSVQVSQKHQLAMLSRLQLPQITAWCQAETDAEAIRLGYVALTRASLHNIVIEQPEKYTKNGKKSNNKSRDHSIWERLKQTLTTPLNEQSFTQCIDDTTDTTDNADNNTDNTAHQRGVKNHHQSDSPTLALTVKSPDSTWLPQWKMTSFSALQMQFTEHVTPRWQTADNSLPPDALQPNALMHFAAGPKAGTALHSLYEWYMQHRVCDQHFIDYTDKVLNDAFLGKMSFDATAIAHAVAETATVTLYPQTFCLNDISRDKQSIEMSFFLHLSRAERGYLYQQFGQANRDKITGYLQGFIDYCFCHDDKYYVLDYKSNRLSEQVEDYHQSAMQSAMDEHRYDSQALIYTLALCRHLGIDNAEDYQRRIGGYYYLFIRGMHPQSPRYGIYFNRVAFEALAPLLST